MMKLYSLTILCFVVIGADAFARITAKSAALQSKSHQAKNFLQLLQSSCHTPRDLLKNVGQHLSTNNGYEEGRVASLVLIRLAKMMITIDNKQFESHAQVSCTLSNEDVTVISHICQVLSTCIQQSDYNNEKIIDTAVDGIKAAAVLSRILSRSSVIGNQMSDATIINIVNSCRSFDPQNLEPHHLSGLIWSFDCFEQQCVNINIPEAIISNFHDLKLPFRVRPGFLANYTRCVERSVQFELALENIIKQVDFCAEEIQTSSNQVVRERRQTAWQGEADVPGFAYSGKIMETKSFSPVVRTVRDILNEKMGSYYDCCLLNLYPDGDSGMRYHIDPEQGLLWGFDTCVVSVGATRRFAFRNIPGKETDIISQPHNFVVMDGDVTHMFNNCQSKFQHAVKTSENKGEKASRSSLVFKQCLMK